jgi:hypothetical protein
MVVIRLMAWHRHDPIPAELVADPVRRLNQACTVCRYALNRRETAVTAAPSNTSCTAQPVGPAGSVSARSRTAGALTLPVEPLPSLDARRRSS